MIHNYVIYNIRTTLIRLDIV